MQASAVQSVPYSLRAWFILHFLVDMLFAVPLLFFPAPFLSFLGWGTIDPFAARLVGAALVGIGGMSWWMRNEGREAYSVMLRLKIVWSGAAMLAIVLSMIEHWSIVELLLFALFAGFFGVWMWFFRNMHPQP